VIQFHQDGIIPVAGCPDVDRGSQCYAFVSPYEPVDVVIYGFLNYTSIMAARWYVVESHILDLFLRLAWFV
jgi:hypothetical protein